MRDEQSRASSAPRRRRRAPARRVCEPVDRALELPIEPRVSASRPSSSRQRWCTSTSTPFAASAIAARVSPSESVTCAMSTDSAEIRVRVPAQMPSGAASTSEFVEGWTITRSQSSCGACAVTRPAIRVTVSRMAASATGSSSSARSVPVPFATAARRIERSRPISRRDSDVERQRVGEAERAEEWRKIAEFMGAGEELGCVAKGGHSARSGGARREALPTQCMLGAKKCGDAGNNEWKR